MAKPRWLRFSLRTLFVVVTIVCIWLGWQLKWIRDRREFREAALAKFISHRFDMTPQEGDDPPTLVPAPFPLSLFGEVGYEHFALYVDGEDSDHFTSEDRRIIAEAERLFPESIIGFTHSFETSDGRWGFSSW